MSVHHAVRVAALAPVQVPCGTVGLGACTNAVHKYRALMPHSALDAATKVQAAGTERTNLPRIYQRLRPLKNLSEAAAKDPAIDSASSESPSGVQILMGMVIGLSMPKFS